MHGPEAPAEEKRLAAEIVDLKRQLAKRDEKVGVLSEMVRRAAREMRSGSKELLADLAAVMKS